MKMTIKQLIKLEDRSKQVWVVSPSLHFDIENKAFTELVSVNLGEKTKYRYIVPATSRIAKNMNAYQKMYGLTKAEMDANFLLLPVSEFNPFITEIAIYDASIKSKCCAVSAPALEDKNEVIKFSKSTTESMVKAFKSLWKKYKRQSL